MLSIIMTPQSKNVKNTVKENYLGLELNNAWLQVSFNWKRQIYLTLKNKHTITTYT